MSWRPFGRERQAAGRRSAWNLGVVVARHELRTLYGGPLCVSRAERSQQEVVEVQQRVHEALGSDALGSGGDFGGRVTVTVPVVDDELRTRVAEVDPEGIVELIGWLQPVE